MSISVSLYWNTIKYLKPKQFYRRLWFRVVKPKVLDAVRPEIRNQVGEWVACAQRRASLVATDTFLFLNVEGKLSEISWDGPQREKLWRYNQHYFDDLNASESSARAAWHHDLLAHWVVDNPPGCGVGWEPYPTSLRIVNWVKWHCAGHQLSEDCLQSLAVQVRWLNQRMEWHLLGNHLFANAKALVFAGALFDGPEARGWLDKGLRIINQELPEQELDDGGNFERSPMYHAIFLEDLLDLINLSGAYPGLIDREQVNAWRECASLMLNWLNGMTHPDGEISFFNDAAIGVAPTPAALNAYALRLGVGGDIGTKPSECAVKHFADSGYVRLQANEAAAFLDVAPVGPDYLPGHAHADTLSFELSLFGQRVIVNGGTSEYGCGAIRQMERGTAAHNTVEIDAENSSEVWSGFRVARRAYPKGLEISEGDDSVSVSCGHDGYERLSGKPTHWREWTLFDHKLEVCDRIEGAFNSAVARCHLHPDVQAVEEEGGCWLLKHANFKQPVRVQITEGLGSLEPSYYAPEFGKRQQSHCLAVRFGPTSKVGVSIKWGAHE